MIANEAPEKIYCGNNGHGNLSYSNQMFPNAFEYTCNDAFIEKACNGIEKLLSGYIIRNFNFGDSYDIDRFIEDFRNYMKLK